MALDVAARRIEAGEIELCLAGGVDSYIQGETLDDLAAAAGVGVRIAAITARAMNGEIDFPTALRERLAMLEGL